MTEFQKGFHHGVFRAVGFIWLLPVTIIAWTFYVLPLWALGEIEWDGWRSVGIAQFKVPTINIYKQIGSGGVYEIRREMSWYRRRWVGWWGWGGPCVIFWKPTHQFSIKDLHKIFRHEERHCDQMFLFGPLFYPLYIGFAVWLYLRGDYAHINNPFEIDAREHADQPINYSPKELAKRKRWPWW